MTEEAFDEEIVVVCEVEVAVLVIVVEVVVCDIVGLAVEEETGVEVDVAVFGGAAPLTSP